MQRFEKRLERPRRQRLKGMGGLVLREGLQSVALIDGFGLVREQHRVTVECDPHLVRVAARRLCRLRVHPCLGTLGIQRAHYVVLVGRK